ncbi:MAG: hypothetical protein K0S34_2075 [Bacillales bacterium]|nr:hypothetical protein [Bacillales bacterium]
MKKLLVVAGLAGAFFIGSMSTGNIFTSANTDTLQNKVE